MSLYICISCHEKKINMKKKDSYWFSDRHVIEIHVKALYKKKCICKRMHRFGYIPTVLDPLNEKNSSFCMLVVLTILQFFFKCVYVFQQTAVRTAGQTKWECNELAGKNGM